MPDRSPYLTVAEAADLLRVHRQVIYRMVERGTLRAIRVGEGRAIRIPRTALDELDEPATRAV